MWTQVIVLLVWIVLNSGNEPIYKGCYSTSFVIQYAHYYKLNQSLSIEECLAACNNRLTRYMGLKVDESYPVNSYVFCGNDLPEVSSKSSSSKCIPCQENRTYSCGGNDSMSVYLLRDFTPLALLMMTDRGVEMLVDNTTTLKVAYTNSSQYQLIDYVYTDDMIITAINKNILKSSYNPLTMKYRQLRSIRFHYDVSEGFAVDFITHNLYLGFHGDNDLHKTDTQGSPSDNVLSSSFIPEQISIDPYNRSLVFISSPYNSIEIFLWDKTYIKHSLAKFHVHKIKALSMETHEKLLYAIVSLEDGLATYFVKFDYEISEMKVLFSGIQLENATHLEVFKDNAVWLSNASNKTTIFKCKLTPKCHLENLTSFTVFQMVYDFTIYHPEKQTPGKKRLCEDLLYCCNGCQIFSPFTARCACPGTELNPDNFTCIERSSTPSLSTTHTTEYEKLSPGLASSTTSSDELPVPTPNMELNASGNKLEISSGIKFYIGFITICCIVTLFLTIALCVLGIKLYKSVHQINQVLKTKLELKSVNNDYSESFLLN